MNPNAHTVLIVIALILAVASIIRPTWLLVAVSVILICADLLIN
jgi:hypothetical protein